MSVAEKELEEFEIKTREAYKAFTKKYVWLCLNQGNRMFHVKRVKAKYDKDNNIISEARVVHTYKATTALKQELLCDPHFAYITINQSEEKTKIDMVETAINGFNGTNLKLLPMKRWDDIDFSPEVVGNESNESGEFNIFEGFKVTPKEGDISIFMDIMKKAYDPEHLNIMLDWFAQLYQQPHIKPLWAVVVKGDKGTGKNTLEEMLGRGLLYTDNYFRTADTNALFGRFTGHLASVLLISGQEILWGGDHKHDSTIKDMITERTRKLERKGIDATIVANHSRLFMTSNADWVVPASGKTERRYFVTETKTGVTKAEWSQLYRWYNTGPNAKKALLYMLLNRDISKLDLHTAPETNHLEDQKEQSLYGFDKFIKDLIENGYGISQIGNSGKYKEAFIVKDRVGRVALFEVFKADNNRDKMNAAQFYAKLIKEYGFERKRIRGIDKLSVPTRKELGDRLYENTGVKVKNITQKSVWMKEKEIE